MWLQRRKFAFDAPPQVEGARGRALHSGASYVTVFTYMSIPFDSVDVWQASTAWYETTDSTFDRLVAPASMEFFVIGWQSGVVERKWLCPSGMRLRSDAPVVDSLRMYCHRSDVMAIDQIGSLVATVGADGCLMISTVSAGHRLHANIQVSKRDQMLRSVKLWEGKAHWTESDPDNEAAAVYVFAGNDCGEVHLYRVDISGNVAPQLMKIFVCSICGFDGDSGRAADHASVRLITSMKIFSLGIDEEKELLIAGCHKRIFCWSLQHDTLDVWPKGGALFRAPMEWESTLTSLSPNVSSSKLFNKFVMLRPPAEGDHADVDAATARRLRTAQKSKAIGQVTNMTVRCAEVGGRTLLYHVMLQGMKRELVVDASKLLPVQESTLSFAADDAGPVFAVNVLCSGLLVSGGSDGSIRLFHFSEATSRFELTDVSDASRRHTDAVRSIGGICSPATFFSASLDGTVRTWRIAEGLKLTVETAVAVLRSHPSNTDIPSREVRDFAVLPGVASAQIHRDIGALFVLQFMESELVSFVFEQVDSCELPPGWFFDGIRSAPRQLNSSQCDAGESGDTEGLDACSAAAASADPHEHSMTSSESDDT